MELPGKPSCVHRRSMAIFLSLGFNLLLLTSFHHTYAYTRNISKVETSVSAGDVFTDKISSNQPLQVPSMEPQMPKSNKRPQLGLGLLRQPSTMSHTDFNRIADSLLTQVPKSRYESILSGVYLQNDARKIGSHLREISNQELGVTAMQAAFDSTHSLTEAIHPAEEVKKISEKLRGKVAKYLTLLDRNRLEVKMLYQQHKLNPYGSTHPCCKIDQGSLKFDEHFGTLIAKDQACDTVPPHLSDDAFQPGANLSKVFKHNLEEHPSVRWQYFMSSAGLHTEFPSYNLDTELICRQETESRHRNEYFRTVQPYAKHVVIVIDHGNSMSSLQLNTAKTIGKYIISMLSHHDKVGLIGLAGEAQYPQSGGCHPEQMAYVTYETKFQFSRFIDGLEKAKDPTDHLMGFNRAFEMIRSSLDLNPNSTDSPGEALILYISRGLLSSIADAKVILENIGLQNLKSGNKVVINTYTVLEEGKPVMYEKAFLQDVAEQNYERYHLDMPNSGKIRPGFMVTVNSTENLAATVGNFFSVLTTEVSPGIHYSLPHWDSIGKGLVVSITRPVYFLKELVGVVGVDVPLSDMADGVTYYGELPHSYAFLMEETGVAVMHPSFLRPSCAQGQPMHTDVWHLEQRGDTRRIKRNIVNEVSGEDQVHLTNNSNTPLWRSVLDRDTEMVVSLQYNWHKVEGTPYTACIVTSLRKEEYKNLKGKKLPNPSLFSYHRLDLAPTAKGLCRHLKQLSTIDVSTVFFSAASFDSPFNFLRREETIEEIMRYMDYLSDQSDAVPNPGLKNAVRNDVLTIAVITNEWKKKTGSEFSKYVVRRYIATQGGVFLTYPGTVIDKIYDPTKRDWFTRALEFPGRVIVSAPYLDVGGAGYIVTVSSVIFEGKYASMHSTSDRVVAVMAMDLTLGYFYKLVIEVVNVCEQDRVSCFLMDDRGYLISHPSLIEPSSRGSAEQQHITHKEPLVAGDILNHKDFAKKKLCNSFSDRTIQRFYQFNTSLEGVLTNLVHGESCAKYMLTAIPGTNIFLGIVNQTCETVTTFCPCSITTDRLCLNCHLMEQTVCECPCECPLEMNLCSGSLMDDNDNNPSCPRFAEEPHSPVIEEVLLDSVEQCYESKCHTRNNKNDCFGVLGCEWCQLDNEGFSLKKEFCTEQRKCFGGVLGARTPYADEIVGLPMEDYFSIRNTPVGPVAGGIMGLFLVLAMAFYCYRYHVHRVGPPEYMTSPDAGMHMSHLENDPEEPELNEDHVCRGAAAHSNMVLASFENAAVVSPYRVATGYRRRPGGDSDPGYSTMTPHEDSEHVPYIEPLLLGSKDRQRGAPPSQLSMSSRSSTPSTFNPNAITPPGASLGSSALPSGRTVLTSPNATTGVANYNWGQMFTNTKELCQTIIPENSTGHQLVAQVQVHMADAR